MIAYININPLQPVKGNFNANKVKQVNKETVKGNSNSVGCAVKGGGVS